MRHSCADLNATEGREFIGDAFGPVYQMRFRLYLIYFHDGSDRIRNLQNDIFQSRSFFIKRNTIQHLTHNHKISRDYSLQHQSFQLLIGNTLYC